MRSTARVFRVLCLVAGVTVISYGVSYPILRITHVLVARDYAVCRYNRWGDERTVEHFDIGRGSAFGQGGEWRSVSATAILYAPLSWVELQIRGYGRYPITWPHSKVGMNEEVARVKMAMPKTRSILPETTNAVPPEVIQRWRETESYYALAEIADALMNSGATKADVLLVLGDPNWGTVNQDPARTWGYQGFGKHEPNSNKAMLMFNDKDELIDIGWVSE